MFVLNKYKFQRLKSKNKSQRSLHHTRGEKWCGSLYKQLQKKKIRLNPERYWTNGLSSQRFILKWSNYIKDVLKYLQRLLEGNLISLNLRRSPHPYDCWSLQNLAFDKDSLSRFPLIEYQSCRKHLILFLTISM